MEAVLFTSYLAFTFGFELLEMLGRWYEGTLQTSFTGWVYLSPSPCGYWLLKVHTCHLQSIPFGLWEVPSLGMPGKIRPPSKVACGHWVTDAVYNSLVFMLDGTNSVVHAKFQHSHRIRQKLDFSWNNFFSWVFPLFILLSSLLYSLLRTLLQCICHKNPCLRLCLKETLLKTSTEKNEA